VTYLSVCSGIEAATVAWHPLGWRATAFSEIESFPCAVLAHHYADVPNLGDMTAFKEWKLGSINLLVGGTPCQSFSVAGLRRGLDDPRGNLMLVYLAIARAFAPRWVVWENVPGVLSSHKGRDFGTFLGGLAECGYGFAYRVLDAQFFGVPQRRRRVFVVGYLGDWRIAAAVLFERESLRGYPPPSREAGEDVAAAIVERIGKGGFTDPVNDNIIAFDTTQITHPKNRSRPEPGDPVQTLAKGGHAPAIAQTLQGQSGRNHTDQDYVVAHSLRAEHDASEDGTGRGTPLVAQIITADMYRSGGATAGFNPGVRNVISCTLRGHPRPGSNSLGATTGVRRLTPRECERLQGFPDDYTFIQYPPNPRRVKWAADGPRYKALGNSMAVPVMRWIGERIKAVQMELEVDP
jgi:DNA (cytosine-5)-methyltransferase 1